MTDWVMSQPDVSSKDPKGLNQIGRGQWLDHSRSRLPALESERRVWEDLTGAQPAASCSSSWTFLAGDPGGKRRNESCALLSWRVVSAASSTSTSSPSRQDGPEAGPGSYDPKEQSEAKES